MCADGHVVYVVSFAQSLIHYSSVAAKLVRCVIVIFLRQWFTVIDSIPGCEFVPIPDQWAAGIRGLSHSTTGPQMDRIRRHHNHTHHSNLNYHYIYVGQVHRISPKTVLGGGQEEAFAPPPLKKDLPPLRQTDLCHIQPHVFSCYPPGFLCVVCPPLVKFSEINPGTPISLFFSTAMDLYAGSTRLYRHHSLVERHRNTSVLYWMI